MTLFLLQPSIIINYTNSICRGDEGGAIFIGKKKTSVNDDKNFQWIQIYLSIYFLNCLINYILKHSVK